MITNLSRPFFGVWGDDWAGKSPPYLYRFFREQSFKPTDERNEIVFVVYILPDDINMGYQGLGRMVVSKVNGKAISCMKDVADALALSPENGFNIFEFEQDYPSVVIARDKLADADQRILRNYGIEKALRIE